MKKEFCMLDVKSDITSLIEVTFDLPLLRSTDNRILPCGTISVGTGKLYVKVNSSRRDVTSNVPLYTAGLAP